MLRLSFFKSLSYVLVLAVLMMGAPLRAAETPSTFTPEQTQAIEKIVANYLANHPEEIVQSVTRAEERRRITEAQKARQLVKEKYAEIAQNPTSPSAGNSQGDVALVEYFDYQCGYCKAVAPYVQTLLKEDKNLRVVFKEYPILGPNSRTAAQAALAANKQGKYMAFHTALMSEKGGLDEDKIFQVAQSVGLDLDRLKQDMKSPEVTQEIESNLSLAPEIGIRGTPAFVIGHEVVAGAIPLEDMKKIIQVQREHKAQLQ